MKQSSNKENIQENEIQRTEGTSEFVPEVLPDGFVRKSHRKLKPTQLKRRYLTGLDGKRRYVRVVPAQGRGPDKTPRKSGPEHALYVHGQGKSRSYSAKHYAAWKEGVLRKGGFRCLVTGERNNLTCHHLKSWDWCEEGRYDIKNGVVLADRIHKQFHSAHGSGGNTLEQFKEFLRVEYNMTFDVEQYGNHEPSLITENVESILVQQENVFKTKNDVFNELLESRHHFWIAGEYVNLESQILVHCCIHNTEHYTTVRNYKKSRTGCPCCGRARQSEATSHHNTLRGKV